MRNRIFGWDLPPGVTQRHINEQFGGDAGCDICGLPVEDCECRCSCAEPQDEGDGQCKLCGKEIPYGP